VEEDDDHEEHEGDMQVDFKTDEHNKPKDPSSNPKKKVTSFPSRS
jgi:hypothetical protein